MAAKTKEDIKIALELVSGIGRPSPKAIAVRVRTPRAFKLKDDGKTPNNRLPLVIYRSAVDLEPAYDPAAIFEVLFKKNRWKDSWRYTMYGYNHFHTRTHECLGIARGTLTAQFGESKGRQIILGARDVVTIPAGVGHKHVRQSKDLLIVGSYPANAGPYDEPTPAAIDHEDAVERVGRIKLPPTDPVYGRAGPLFRVWRR